MLATMQGKGGERYSCPVHEVVDGVVAGIRRPCASVLASGTSIGGYLHSRGVGNVVTASATALESVVETCRE